MRSAYGVVALASLVSSRPAPESTLIKSQALALAYVDQETGFTFSESKAAATLSSNIIYRIATPANVPSGQPYDVVLQIVAPNSIGWAGLAWGGSMVRNPLTVSYPNGQKTTASSRWATGHSTPQSYTGATLTLLSKGNKSNSTHWQLTAKCTGCTSWTGTSGATRIDPKDQKRLGFACAAAKPSSPGSNTSTIPVHDVYNYFTHDFAAGANANFASLLTKNGISGGGAETGNVTMV
ncbi:hypothetical protein HBH98_021320 [Parastagonospora nodorum]|nr:hypothetical protein HBH98_021320 [Parastagonospora nodorum]KAH4363419.1 hypothetical protein HBH97_185040 [Parastagonospora nodorum]KAH4426048.1 hypothetical protein HBH99_027930 [Parastagonospora nodorum]KAH5151360.1 hypothetical protein HBH70_005290 [Parastagonospora nodorum]KAH5477889.1 hypothetical protein HBI28_064510 [Parastagonospora nodorum]